MIRDGLCKYIFESTNDYAKYNGRVYFGLSRKDKKIVQLKIETWSIKTVCYTRNARSLFLYAKPPGAEKEILVTREFKTVVWTMVSHKVLVCVSKAAARNERKDDFTGRVG